MGLWPMFLVVVAPQFLASPCDWGERVEIGRQIIAPGFSLSYGAGSDGCGEAYGNLRLTMSGRFDRQEQFFTVDPADPSEWSWRVMIYGAPESAGRPLAFADRFELWRRDVDLVQAFNLQSDAPGFDYLASLSVLPAMVLGTEFAYNEFADSAAPVDRWFVLNFSVTGSFGPDALADWRGAAFVPEPPTLSALFFLLALATRRGFLFKFGLSQGS